MHKRIDSIVICLLLLGAVLGCSRSAELESTATPMATVTLEPTSTPEFTATPEPAPTTIPGWEKFEGGGIEIWLPESYEGGDLSKDLDLIVKNLRALGPDFEQMAQTIEQNPHIYAIWATDSVVGDSGFLTNVTIVTEETLSTVTLDMYLDALENQFPEQFQMVERDSISLGDYPAGRLIIEFAISGMTGKEVLYVIQDASTFWILTFATGLEEFDQRLPDFEQAALTFRVQP